jgi:hypothetical protein
VRICIMGHGFWKGAYVGLRAHAHVASNCCCCQVRKGGFHNGYAGFVMMPLASLEQQDAPYFKYIF